MALIQALPLKDAAAACGKLWTSASRVVYGETGAIGGIIELSGAALATSEAVRRLGLEAIDRHGRIKAARAERRDLAYQTASGKLNQLLAGDLNTDDPAKAAAICARVAALTASLKDDACFFRGGGWTGDAQTHARRLLGLPAGALSAEQQAALAKAT